jgi:hypothetical protein
MKIKNRDSISIRLLANARLGACQSFPESAFQVRPGPQVSKAFKL